MDALFRHFKDCVTSTVAQNATLANVVGRPVPIVLVKWTISILEAFSVGTVTKIDELRCSDSDYSGGLRWCCRGAE